MLWDYKYVIYGKEVGKEGTPHYQGFVTWPNPKSLTGVKKVNPRAHWEAARGTPAQAIQYCKKDGDFVEDGVKPLSPKEKGQMEKDRWQTAWDLAKEGRIEEIEPGIRYKHFNTTKRIIKDYMKPAQNTDGVCGIWIHGPSGSGKSHVVRTTYPDAFQKPVNKWWCGYQEQPVVHLDEVEPKDTAWITPYLKKWADKWSFPAEVKGGGMSIRPKLFIVTSNYSIDEMNFDPKDQPAIKRRFKELLKTREQDILI